MYKILMVEPRKFWNLKFPFFSIKNFIYMIFSWSWARLIALLSNRSDRTVSNFQPFREALEFFLERVLFPNRSFFSGGGTLACICLLYKYLYVSVRMYSITWLTPKINWSSIGGTQGLLSSLRIFLELRKSNWPSWGGNTVKRFPCKWSSLRLVQYPISSGTSTSSLSRIARIRRFTKFLIFGDKISMSLSLKYRALKIE